MVDSPFYSIYKEIFDSVYTSRATFDRKTYVSVPIVEAHLQDYAGAPNYSFAVLNGPAGTGKSTAVYEFVARLRQDKNTKYLALVYDCRGEYSDHVKLNVELNETNRPLFVNASLGLKILEFLIRDVSEDIFDVENTLCSIEFLTYCRKYFLKYLPVFARGAEIKHFERNVKTHNKFFFRFKHEFLLDENYAFNVAIVSLRYLLHIRVIDRFFLAIDNTENEHSTAIVSFASALNQIISVLKSSGTQPEEISVLLSCRTESFERLKLTKGVNIFGVQGTRVIPHDEFAPLIEILKKRAERVNEKFDHVMRGGAMVRDIDPKKAFNGFVVALEKHGITDLVAKLMNYNIAKSMEVMEYLTQSETISLIDYIAESGMISGGQSPIASRLSEASVLSYLLYGNVTDRRQRKYPKPDKDGTIYIPNIISWTPYNEGSIFIKLRIYQLIRNMLSRSGSGNLASVAEVTMRASELLGLDSQYLFTAVTQMVNEDYLISYENELQDHLNDFDAVSISQKCELIVGFLSEYGVLSQAFFDDFPLPESELQDELKSLCGGLLVHIHLIPSFIQVMWDAERKHLESILKAEKGDRYKYEYGRDIWSATISNGVLKRLHYLLRREKMNLSDRLGALQGAMNKVEAIKSDITKFERSDQWLDTITSVGLDSKVVRSVPEQLSELKEIVSSTQSASEAKKNELINLIDDIVDQTRTGLGDSNERRNLIERVSEHARNANIVITFGEKVAKILSDI